MEESPGSGRVDFIGQQEAFSPEPSGDFFTNLFSTVLYPTIFLSIR